MEAIEARPLIIDPDVITRAGAFVSLNCSGQLSVYRGYVRSGDEPRAEIAADDDSDHDAVKKGQGSFAGFFVSDMVWAFPPEG